MSNLIQAGYGMKIYDIPAKARGGQQANAAVSFMEMAMQAGIGRACTLTGGQTSFFGSTAVMAARRAELVQQRMEQFGTESAKGAEQFGTESARGVGQPETENVREVSAPSLEQMLKAKYPGLAYHVFDGSSSAWRTRNDYPHYLLYQQDIDTEAIENWKPSGPNPFYGSVNGKFIAPKEIKALGNVPPGSKAVVIHPKVQERMEQDPEYAFEIMERIETWFTFDQLRNEAIMPGSSVGMSQAVAIGEDGSIVNAQASRAGGEITRSSDEMVRAYYLRLAKRAEFMRWLAKEQIKDSMEAASMESAAEAKAQLQKMMEGGRLLEIFGDTIAGVPTQTILAMTQAEVWGA